MITKDMNASLPVSPSDLQAMVLELSDKMAEQVKNYELEIRLLREKILLLQHQLYGRKSEKFPTNLMIDDGYEQDSLFEEPDEAASAEPCTVEEITIPGHKRAKRGRKSLPPELPRIEVVHDLSESEKQCGCGSEMKRIGQEVSEQLEMVPARFWVMRHIRPKYACKACEGVERKETESSVKM